MLVARPALAALHCVYDPVRVHHDDVADLWSSVRLELEIARNILPLLVSRLGSSWDPVLTTSDSSELGFGVNERTCDPNLIGSWGRLSERWRYDFEDAVSARAHALDPDPAAAVASAATAGCLDGFEEIPKHELLGAAQWKTVLSKRWLHEENIMRTEGRALEFAIRRRFRSTRVQGRRLLFLVDNLSLCLSLAKGRSSSAFLLPTCKVILAYALATGSHIHVRWIPSEYNPSDKPSRVFSDDVKWISNIPEHTHTSHSRASPKISNRSKESEHADGSQARPASGQCCPEEASSCGPGSRDAQEARRNAPEEASGRGPQHDDRVDCCSGPALEEHHDRIRAGQLLLRRLARSPAPEGGEGPVRARRGVCEHLGRRVTGQPAAAGRGTDDAKAGSAGDVPFGTQAELRQPASGQGRPVGARQELSAEAEGGEGCRAQG